MLNMSVMKNKTLSARHTPDTLTKQLWVGGSRVVHCGGNFSICVIRCGHAAFLLKGKARHQSVATSNHWTSSSLSQPQLLIGQNGNHLKKSMFI